MIQFMDNVKLRDKSMIEILDPTCVNQANHTITLRKESEMYNDMTMEFNKEVASMNKDARARVSLHIAKAMHAFVKGGKKIIKIPYFLSKFHMYF
jgi:hypothetical protein